MSDVIKSYSPNIAWGKQVVEIVLKQWAYEKAFVVRVGGNCVGFAIFEAALSNLLDQLWPHDTDFASVTLTDPAGDTLLSEDEEDAGEFWLQRMVVSVRILAYEPPSLNEVRKMNGARPLLDGNRLWEPL